MLLYIFEENHPKLTDFVRLTWELKVKTIKLLLFYFKRSVIAGQLHILQCKFSCSTGHFKNHLDRIKPSLYSQYHE